MLQVLQPASHPRRTVLAKKRPESCPLAIRLAIHWLTHADMGRHSADPACVVTGANGRHGSRRHDLDQAPLKVGPVHPSAGTNRDVIAGVSATPDSSAQGATNRMG